MPLLQRSLELWKDLQGYYEKKRPEAPSPLLSLCGGLMIGQPHHSVVAGTLKSIEEHNLPHKILSPSEVKEKYPMFHLQEGEIAVHEENAGYLDPERCVEAHTMLAQVNSAV